MPKEVKRKVGRPKRVYTEDEIASVTRYARMGCHTLTIANATGIPESNLRQNFSEVMLKQRALHKVDLRKEQGKACKNGNPALLIFLGKNILEQKDKVETDVNHHVADLATFLKAMKT